MKAFQIINPSILKLPLLLMGLCTFCCAKNSHAQDPNRQSNMRTFRGNTFEIGKTPDGGRAPVKMNGKKIYNADDLTNSVETVSDGVDYLLLGQLNDLWEKLPDGDYYVMLRNMSL